ncbi:MAG: hypothetical protein IH946_09350, partial [Bacteroidetes bacterium]|nr:hypothetical protein [Bacteroidota bacterium]
MRFISILLVSLVSLTTLKAQTDIGIVAILNPFGGCELKDEIVFIVLQNFGSVNVDSLPVSYQFNGGTVITDTIPAVIPIGGSYLHIFSVPASFTGPGAYNVISYFQAPGDTISSNDTLSITVHSWPNPVANAGTDTSVCSADTLQLSGSGGVSFSWTSIFWMNSKFIPNPLTSPLANTEYILEVATDSGCRDRDTVVVDVKGFELVQAL